MANAPGLCVVRDVSVGCISWRHSDPAAAGPGPSQMCQRHPRRLQRQPLDGLAKQTAMTATMRTMTTTMVVLVIPLLRMPSGPPSQIVSPRNKPLPWLWPPSNTRRYTVAIKRGSAVACASSLLTLLSVCTRGRSAITCVSKHDDRHRRLHRIAAAGGNGGGRQRRRVST